MSVTAYIRTIADSFTGRSAGNTLYFYCSTYAELPTGASTINGDSAYCVDDGKRYDRTAGAWVLRTTDNLANAIQDLSGDVFAIADLAEGEFFKVSGNQIITQAIAGGGDMLKSENLSGLANVTVARTNLGLGTAAITAASAYATAAQGTTADSALQPTGNGSALTGITAAMVGAPSGNGTATGTNTGDQTITLTGDVTGAGTGSFAATLGDAKVVTAKIADGNVTLAKLSNGTTGSGNFVLASGAALTSPTMTTPAIGVATGTSLAVTGVLTSNGTAGFGYATGAGGAVTQLTNKSTAVTLNKTVGAITMNAAALAAAAEVTFNVVNSTMTANDLVVVNHKSGGTAGAYSINAHSPTAGQFRIMVGNMSAGSLSEAIVIAFAIIKGAVAAMILSTAVSLADWYNK